MPASTRAVNSLFAGNFWGSLMSEAYVPYTAEDLAIIRAQVARVARWSGVPVERGSIWGWQEANELGRGAVSRALGDYVNGV